MKILLLFPRNFRMVFLPHTNTVILLEPYCGTITEPGLPVVSTVSTRNAWHNGLLFVTPKTDQKFWRGTSRKNGWDVQHVSWNPYPISDQNLWFQFVNDVFAAVAFVDEQLLGSLSKYDDDHNDDFKTTIALMIKTTALHVHHSFLYISLTSTARLRRETSLFDVLWRTWTYDDEFSNLFLNLNKILKNSTPGKVACIWHIERVQIDAIKFERTQIHFFTDVLTAWHQLIPSILPEQ